MNRNNLSTHLAMMLIAILFSPLASAEKIDKREQTGNETYEFLTYEDAGTIYFYWEPSSAITRENMELYLNDNFLGLAHNGSAFVVKAPPGENDIWFMGRGNLSAFYKHRSVFTEKNRKYYFSIALSWGNISILEVSENTGEKKIQKIIFN